MVAAGDVAGHIAFTDCAAAILADQTAGIGATENVDVFETELFNRGPLGYADETHAVSVLILSLDVFNHMAVAVDFTRERAVFATERRPVAGQGDVCRERVLAGEIIGDGAEACLIADIRSGYSQRCSH